MLKNMCAWFITFPRNVNNPDFVLKIAKLPIVYLCYLNVSHLLNEWHNLCRNAKSNGINLTLSRWRSFAFLNRRLIYPLNTIIKIKLFYWTLKKRGFTRMNISCNESVQINNFIPIEILHFIFVSFWISSIKNCNIHVMLLLSSIHTHILPLERLFLPNSCSTRKKASTFQSKPVTLFFCAKLWKTVYF